MSILLKRLGFNPNARINPIGHKKEDGWEVGFSLLNQDGARMPYFYDPTSFEVTINRELFPDVTNLKVLSYCGIYENNGNKTENSAFREALGIGSLDTPKYALPNDERVHEVNDIDFSHYDKHDSLAIWLPIGNDTLLIPVKTADEYKEADLKLFDNPAYKSYGSETDIHYYGQELSFDGKDASS